MKLFNKRQLMSRQITAGESAPVSACSSTLIRSNEPLQYQKTTNEEERLWHNKRLSLVTKLECPSCLANY